MTTMPAEITYGHVTGRFIAAWTDGPDAGRTPDPRPLEGLTVKITPKVQVRRLAGASPVLVATMPVTCKVDDDGRLIDEQGNPGVWLVTGVYGVSYTHPAVAIRAHDIEVTDAHTEGAPLDLVTAMPPGGPVLTASQYAELSARIDGIVVEAGAVSSVNGKTGAVTLSAADVGALPSTYTPPAQSWSSVTGKPSTFTPATHTHAVADVTGLQAALDGKQAAGSYAPVSHVHAISDVTGLQTALDTAGAPQTLSLTGQDLSLSGGGGTVTLPSGGGGGGGGASRYGVPTFGLSGVLVWNFRDTSDSIEAANGTALLTRVILADETPIKAIGMQVYATGSTGAVIRVSLYAPDGAGGGPGTLIVDAGTVDATTGGWKEATFTAVTAPAGPVWVALTTQGSPATLPRIAGGNAPAHLALTSPADFVGPSGIAQGAGMTGPAASTWAYTITVPTGPAAPSVALRTA